MPKSSQEALRELTAAITELAEVVREIDPGPVRQYDLIAVHLEKARGHIIQAAAYEA